MKKIFRTICLALLLISAIGMAFPQVSRAQGIDNVAQTVGSIAPYSGLGMIANAYSAVFGSSNQKNVPGVIGAIFIEVMEYLAYLAETIASWFLIAMSGLLNASMLLTLNIKTIVDHAAVIGTAWVTIRNFSSICIIFMLLYASILMILGMKGNIGELIKNVVIAGLLINFSLFFTKIAIDGSNIISLSFYSAIAPKFNTSIDSTAFIANAFNNPGIANVFMQSLKIQTAQPPSPALNTSTWQIALGIIISGCMTVVITFVAALSFLAASIAFTIRVVLLLLLMALSPIYFVGMMFPEVEAYAKKWKDYLFSMCVFMPVYLFLMYLAMMVLQDPSFSSFIHSGASSTDTGGNGIIGPGTIGLIVNYVIAMFFINFPLMAALKLGGDVVKVGNNFANSVKKWGQGALKTTGKTAWRETGGRLANSVTQNEKFKDFAGKSVLGEYAYKATRGVSADYNKKMTENVKKKTEFAESLGHDEQAARRANERLREFNARLAAEKFEYEKAKKINDPTLRATAMSSSESKMSKIKADIGLTKGKITQIETARKQAYGARRGEVFGVSGLYHKVARSNFAAAAKVKIDVIEKEIAGSKEDLKETKEDIKNLEKAIINSRANGANGQPGSDAQQDKMLELRKKQSEISDKIKDQENSIERLKLVK